MEKCLLVTCKVCGKIHKHDSWIFLTQEQRTDLFLNYRVEILKGICPNCYEARQLLKICYGAMTSK